MSDIFSVIGIFVVVCCVFEYIAYKKYYCSNGKKYRQGASAKSNFDNRTNDKIYDECENASDQDFDICGAERVSD